MANISWTSSSINSFFNTSLNTKNTAFSGLYSSLGNASMIKSGAYKKLMKSYVNEMSSGKADDKTSSSQSTKRKHANAYTYDKDGNKSTTAISNKILDELLEHKPYTSSVKNTVLDKLLAKDDKTTTTADGTVVDKTESTANVADTTTLAATKTNEALSGAIVDEYA